MGSLTGAEHRLIFEFAPKSFVFCNLKIFLLFCLLHQFFSFFVSFFHKNSSVLDFEKFCFLHHFLFHFYIKNDAKANEIAKTKFLKNPTI